MPSCTWHLGRLQNKKAIAFINRCCPPWLPGLKRKLSIAGRLTAQQSPSARPLPTTYVGSDSCPPPPPHTKQALSSAVETALRPGRGEGKGPTVQTLTSRFSGAFLCLLCSQSCGQGQRICFSLAVLLLCSAVLFEPVGAGKPFTPLRGQGRQRGQHIPLVPFICWAELSAGRCCPTSVQTGGEVVCGVSRGGRRGLRPSLNCGRRSKLPLGLSAPFPHPLLLSDTTFVLSNLSKPPEGIHLFVHPSLSFSRAPFPWELGSAESEPGEFFDMTCLLPLRFIDGESAARRVNLFQVTQ